MNKTLTLLALCSLAIGAPCAAAGGYTYQFIGDAPPGTYGITPNTTYASGINNSGVVVGNFYDAYNYSVEFSWSNGSFHDHTYDALPFRYDQSSELYGISNNGKMTGAYTGTDGVRRLFIYDAGNFTILPTTLPNMPSNALGAPFGINNSGQVAGTYFDSDGAGHGYVYSDGAYTVLDFPQAQAPSDYVWISTAYGINDHGQVAGCFATTNFDYPDGYGYIFDTVGGGYTSLSVPGARDTCATGINNDGVVAGYYTDDVGVWGDKHGFTYKDGIYSLMDDSDFPGDSVDTYITGINDLGQMAGYYYDATFTQHSFVATPTEAGAALPTPGTLPLVAAALLAACGVRTRRRQALANTRRISAP